MAKRKKVAPQTVARVGLDVWMLICAHMEFSPHTVFRLMGACKSIREELGQNPEWWRMFCARVLQYQVGLPHHSNYKNMLVRLERTFGRTQKLLKVVFSRQCCFCGSRYHHRVMPLLGVRVCPTPCLRENLISNIVLFYKYGLSFTDLMQQPGFDPQRILVRHSRQLMCGKKLGQLTQDPYDHCYLRGPVNYWGVVCFFLRQDIQLPAEAAQTARMRAAQLLSARVARAAHPRHAECIVDEIREQRYWAQRRAAQPALPSPYWLVGGGYLAVMTKQHLPIRRYDPETLRALKQQLDAAWKRSNIFFKA